MSFAGFTVFVEQALSADRRLRRAAERCETDGHLMLIPLTYKEAARFIASDHRHRRPPTGGLFAIGLSDGSKVVGCAIVGRPIARMLDDSWTAEVTRLCTDGSKNACSMLYGACWRAARAMGYRRLVTYTLDSESGISLRAAGWKVVAKTDGHSWSHSKRPRVDLYPLQAKLRWEAA